MLRLLRPRFLFSSFSRHASSFLRAEAAATAAVTKPAKQPKHPKEQAAATKKEAVSGLTGGSGYDLAADSKAKVQALCDQILKLNVLEMMELTNKLKSILGMSDLNLASLAVGSAGGAKPQAAGEAAQAEEKKEAPAAAPQKSEFTVVLEKCEEKDRIKVIKEVRSITGLGLKQAKDLVTGAPKPIKKGLKKDEAEKILQQLKEVGATCKLE
eukprot:TRINITY_DN497_c0_g1_i1.p1 TRINITY_DN497_c0_g1~~TRINITY_DN497_c0_g1_i1.p1  ORF type:complete len:212 (-),score=51.19 TRINITY_DN497_c0_g1_i1:73-708(-)